VQEILLTEKSEFFKAACRNGWKEASSRIVRIPDVDVGAFHAYLNWVYREKVAVVSQNARDGKLDTMAEARPVFNELVELWLLADRLADARLQHLVANAITRLACGVPEPNWTEGITPETIFLIWSRTTAGRALRRIVIDFYANEAKSEALERVRDELHPEFIKDLMVKAIEMKNEGKDIHYVDRKDCYYHEHGDHENPRSQNGACCEDGAL
jgi:hypothetical protein